MDKEEAELKRLEKVQQESNQEATDRIREELRAETRLNERKNTVMDYFFELTGVPMSIAWFNEYNHLFNKAQAGYNIKSYIRTKEKEIREQRTLNNEEESKV